MAFTADAFGGDYDGNLSKADFLAFVEEYKAILLAIDQWGDTKKAKRKEIVQAGFSIRQFDRALKEATRSEAERNADDREFRRNMIWMGHPIGFQSDLFEEPPVVDWDTARSGEDGEDTSDSNDISDHHVRMVENAGFAAGREGRDRSINPWQDAFLHGRWDEKWLEGQAEVAGQIKPLRRPRGRPRRLHRAEHVPGHQTD